MHELQGQELLLIDGGRKVNTFASVMADAKNNFGTTIGAYADASGKYFSNAGTSGIAISTDYFSAGISIAYGIAF